MPFFGMYFYILFPDFFLSCVLLMKKKKREKKIMVREDIQVVNEKVLFSFDGGQSIASFSFLLHYSTRCAYVHIVLDDDSCIQVLAR